MEEYIVVDLEMTGLKLKTDRIIEIGAVHICGAEIVDRLHEMVDPDMPLTDKIIELTGITQEEVDAGISQKEAIEKWAEFAGDLPIVGHNVSFDYAFLKQLGENESHPVEHLCADTLKIARACMPQLESKALDALCEHYQIELTQHHRALEDATATYQIYEKMKAEYAAEKPELFEAKHLEVKVKKMKPITTAQIEQITRLSEANGMQPPENLKKMSRAEATRLVETLLRKGRSAT